MDSGGEDIVKRLSLSAYAAALAGCTIERARVLQNARAQMVAPFKDRILGCMGPPKNKTLEVQGLCAWYWQLSSSICPTYTLAEYISVADKSSCLGIGFATGTCKAAFWHSIFAILSDV
jgi:hypothetical protein